MKFCPFLTAKKLANYDQFMFSSVSSGQDAVWRSGQFFGGVLRSLNGSDRRGKCKRDSSVVRRMLLSESWWTNFFPSERQHGRLPAKSDSRCPLKIM